MTIRLIQGTFNPTTGTKAGRGCYSSRKTREAWIFEHAGLADACGSRSSRRARCPGSPSAAATFTAVVVLPLPPFWLVIAIVRKGIP
jgi:hypothetical protein